MAVVVRGCVSTVLAITAREGVSGAFPGLSKALYAPVEEAVG